VHPPLKIRFLAQSFLTCAPEMSVNFKRDGSLQFKHKVFDDLKLLHWPL
jgi:hypothetical protein